MTEQDANTVEESTETESSSGSANLRSIVDDDGFVSTVEFEEVEDTEEADSEGAEQNTPKPKSEKTDFHEHPRFQELIKEKNELAERLAKVEQQKNEPVFKKEPARPKSKYTFKNIMNMSDEDITDQFVSKPKEFLANLVQQAAYEITSDLEAEARAKQERYARQTEQDKVLGTFKNFFQDKEDGIQMLKDGTIKKFLKENPGHNPISAYHSIVGETMYQTRLEKAIKEERDKINRELKAAGRIKPIKSSTTTAGQNNQPIKQADNKADLKRIMLEKARSRQR